MDIVSVFALGIVAVPVIVIISGFDVRKKRKIVYIEDNYSEVKRIR